MYSFNIVLTEKCNAACTHCYMSLGSKSQKKTLTRAQIDQLVEQFPKNTKTVVFTGGEVFLETELLHYAITKTHEHSPNIDIRVESNGIMLYKNKDFACTELETLKSLGVSTLRLSDDIFHAQGGVDLNSVRELAKLATTKTPKITFLYQETAVPIGSAKNLPQNFWAKKNCMNSPKSVKNPYFFLDIDGNVYTCAWKCVPSVGNIFTDEINQIIKNLNSSENLLVLSGKIEEAANLREPGSDKAYRAYAEEHGQCMLCNKIFKEGV